jgi:hypothetical protein
METVLFADARFEMNVEVFQVVTPCSVVKPYLA